MRKLLALTTLVLAACGGGGSDAPSAPQGALPGLYGGEAVSSVTGARTALLGVVLPSGESSFAATIDCHTYFGSAAQSDGSTTLTAVAYSRDYCYGVPSVFRVGWTPNSAASDYTTPLSATGAISIAGVADFSYTTGVGDRGSINLRSTAALWARGSSLARLAGNYKNGSSTAVVSAAGTIQVNETSRDVFSGQPISVSYNVTLALIDPAFNVYRANFSHPRAGTLTGFAYLTDSAASTNDAIFLFAKGIGGDSASFVHYWVK